jgi:hypothetical protein
MFHDLLWNPGSERLCYGVLSRSRIYENYKFVVNRELKESLKQASEVWECLGKSGMGWL